MKTRKINEYHSCQMFIHVSMFILCSLATLKISARDTTYLVRMPASAPEEEVMTIPDFDKPVLLSIFAEDDAGIMAGMRKSLNAWEEKEQYAKNWNLESSGIYKTPTTTEKRQMIANRLLKYADKRLAGEIRNADEGSTLHTVGKVEKSLRPNTEVSVSKLVSLKFRMRVLQGKAIMEVRNPWVESSFTASANGTMKLLTQKSFKDLGVVTGVEFNAQDAQWIAFADKEITENLKARLSSTQKDRSAFRNDAEKRLEMQANFPINF